MIQIATRWLVLVAVVATATLAHAHHRDFSFIRDWYLPFKGESEIESRTGWIPANNTFDQQFEYEYGITNHFAIEPGVGFHKDPDGKLHLDGMDVELRFNFGEFAYDKVLPALNVEFEHPFDPAEPDRGELRFIFSMYGRDGSDLSMNVNVGQQLEGAKEKESEVLLGYVRPIGKNIPSQTHGYLLGLRGGAEFMHNFTGHHSMLGPNAVLRLNEHTNFVATYLFGLDHRDVNPDQFKLIGEYEF